MLARTSFLWLGDLLVDLLIVLTTLAAVICLLPYWGGKAVSYASIDYGLYLYFGFTALFLLLALVWNWRSLQREIATVVSHREQWLVHWSYSQQTWRAYAQRVRDHTYRHLAKWYIIFLLLGAFIGISWIQTFGYTIFWPLLTVISVGLLVTYIKVTLTPYHRVLNTVPEAIISTNGVCIGGIFYCWQQEGSRFGQDSSTKLRSLALVPGQPNMLEFKLYIRSGSDHARPSVYVPVPVGCESQAQMVIERLAPK